MRIDGMNVWTPSWDGYKVDLKRCRHGVPQGGRAVGFRQCGRIGKLVVQDEADTTVSIKDDEGNVLLYCKQHHPDTIAERRAEEEERRAREDRVLDEKYRRSDAIRKFIGYVKTETIEALPTLADLITERGHV